MKITNYRRLLMWGLVLAALLLIPTAWSQLQLIRHASTPAGKLAENMAFTPKAKLIYYDAKPEAKEKSEFRQACPSSATTPELGCYIRGRIYYLQIDRPELAIQMEVTAAHEMLHAVYVDLSDSERRAVDRLIEDQMTRINDPELNETLAHYAKTEPGQRNNELHSILGTEYARLTPALEEYYSDYFTDRSVVVGARKIFHDSIAEYTNALEQQLGSLRSQRASLTSTASRMEYLESTGQYRAYNAEVNGFNAAVRRFNDSVASYNADVVATNAVIGEIDSTQLTTFSEVGEK